MSDLANLARSLHRRGLTPTQIRNRTGPTVNFDRLKPYHPRAGRPAPPGPVSDPGREGEHVVEQLLNRKTLRGRTYYLVRWQGHTSAANSWEPAEHLVHCPERARLKKIGSVP